MLQFQKKLLFEPGISSPLPGGGHGGGEAATGTNDKFLSRAKSSFNYFHWYGKVISSLQSHKNLILPSNCYFKNKTKICSILKEHLVSVSSVGSVHTEKGITFNCGLLKPAWKSGLCVSLNQKQRHRGRTLACSIWQTCHKLLSCTNK